MITKQEFLEICKNFNIDTSNIDTANIDSDITTTYTEQLCLLGLCVCEQCGKWFKPDDIYHIETKNMDVCLECYKDYYM